MNKVIDKLIIMLFCLVFYIQTRADLYAIVPVLAAVTCSALSSIMERDYFRLAIFTVYIAACVYFSAWLFFIPLLAYDLPRFKKHFWAGLAAVPLAVHYNNLPPVSFFSIGLFIVLSRLMNLRTTDVERIRQEYIVLRDSTKEFSLQLEGKNRELMERQDYEINLATLEERNRIARDIHDSVGHLLSSSILQTGALMAGCQDKGLAESLKALHATLVQGMDSIRESIHDLHDDAVDLYSETRTLINGFRLCPVYLDFDIANSPDKKIKFAFIAILKEALANIIKHSDASQVHVTLREHPGLYQLIVADNGSPKALNPDDGIGLKNINDRVNSLGGNMHISSDTGFVLFVSVPREDFYENCNRG